MLPQHSPESPWPAPIQLLDGPAAIQYDQIQSWISPSVNDYYHHHNRSSNQLISLPAGNRTGSCNCDQPGAVVAGAEEEEEDQPPPPLDGGSLRTTAEAAAAERRKRNRHNASERNRRKKINALYSSLRSLMPLPDQAKNLSIPATVSRVVRYIPDLQREVEALRRKNEGLLAANCCVSPRKVRAAAADQGPSCTDAVVSSTSLEDGREFIVQISTLSNDYTIQDSRDHHLALISDVLMLIDDNGLLALDVSSFRSAGGRDFFTIHLSVTEGADTLAQESISCEWLREKLLSVFI